MPLHLIVELLAAVRVINLSRPHCDSLIVSWTVRATSQAKFGVGLLSFWVSLAQMICLGRLGWTRFGLLIWPPLATLLTPNSRIHRKLQLQ